MKFDKDSFKLAFASKKALDAKKKKKKPGGLSGRMAEMGRAGKFKKAS